MTKAKRILSLFICLLMIATTLPMASASDVDAKTLPLDDIWQTGTITETNTEDFYKVTLPSDGKITIKVMHYMSINYYIYNNDFSDCIYDDTWSNGGSESSPVTDTYTHNLSKGIYYIKLSRDYTGNYKIRGTFSSYGCNEVEPNDFDNAYYLNSGTTIKGCFTDTNSSDDWFKIYVPTDCDVSVKLKHYMSINYYIYNYDLSSCIDDDTWSNGGAEASPVTDIYTHTLSKGYYYIKLTKDYSGKYEISWSMKIGVKTPETLEAYYNSTSKIKVKWDSVTCQGYQLQMKKSSGKWTTVTTTKNTSYTKSKLSTGTKYSFRVRAYTSYNGIKYYGSWSNTVYTCTKPNKVKLTSVKAKSRGFTAKWNKTTCSGYQVQYSRYKNFSYSSTYDVSKNSKSKSISWLYGKTKYYVRVRAYTKVGYTSYYGKYSNVKPVKTKK